ncbi:MAG: hypothetical protein AAF399_15185 [Bacteroidota bacterium]
MKFFWGLLLGIHLAVGGYQLFHQRWMMVDSYEYVQAAENLRDHQTLYSAPWEDQSRMHHYSKRPPLYPALLLINDWVLGSELWILLWQIALSMYAIWLTWRMWGMLQPKRTARWWMLPFLLFYPAQVMYSQLVMTELLLQSLLLTSVWGWLMVEREGNGRWLWGSAGLLILSMLTKPVMYLFGLPFLLMTVYWAWTHKRWTWILAGLIPLLFAFSYAKWNEARTGYFHYSSIQNLSLLQYTTHNLLTQVYGPDSALVLSDEIHYAAIGAPSYQEGQQTLTEACTQIVLDHLPQYAWMHTRGMINFFLDPGRFDLAHFWGWESKEGAGFLRSFSENGYAGIWQFLQRQSIAQLLLLFCIACFNGGKLLALVFLPWVKGLSWQEKGVVALLILYVATLTGASGASRFALPVSPLLLLCVGLVGHHWEKIRRKKHQPPVNNFQ